MAQVRRGVRHIFDRIDLEGTQGFEGDAAVDEVEQRLDWFIKKVGLVAVHYKPLLTYDQTMPALARSALSRQKTIIVVPSYFDFVRVTGYLRKNETCSFAAISE